MCEGEYLLSQVHLNQGFHHMPFRGFLSPNTSQTPHQSSSVILCTLTEGSGSCSLRWRNSWGNFKVARKDIEAHVTATGNINKPQWSYHRPLPKAWPSPYYLTHHTSFKLKFTGQTSKVGWQMQAASVYVVNKRSQEDNKGSPLFQRKMQWVQES